MYQPANDSNPKSKKQPKTQTTKKVEKNQTAPNYASKKTKRF